MADRYWVGGSGILWDATDTRGWSTAAAIEFTGSTSGTALTTVGNPALVVGMTVRAAAGTSLGTVVSGSGNSWVLSSSSTQASQTMYAATSGASVPTSSDNVFFTRNATYSANIGAGTRVCNNFTITAGTTSIVGSGSLSVYGSFSLNTGTVWTNSGTLTFASTSTGNTITTNGTSLNLVTFNGVGGEWTLGSALTVAATYSITVSAGSVNSGNYSISTPQFISSGSSVKSISFGSSTITISGALSNAIDFSGATNLTVNAGTSQINLTGNGAGISSNNITFYNVSYTNTAPTNILSITGSNTFNNLSLAARSTVGLSSFSISDNQTISTLTLNPGTTPSCRTMLFSSVFGTTRTLTVGSLASGAADYDFRDMAVVGAAAPLTGTRFGDCKGNSGITFDAAKTVYFRSANNANWSTAGTGVWSLTNGGALDANAFPLAQDTAVFPQTPTAYPTGGNTVTLNGSNTNIGTIDMSARTTSAMTLAAGSFGQNIHGNWINGTGTTITGVNNIIFRGRNTQQITSAGKSFLCGITLNSPGGSLVLQDNLTSTRNASNAFLLANGTLNLNGFTLTLAQLNGTFVTDPGTKNITFGGGTISINSSSSFAFNNAAPTGFTTTGSGVITMVGSSTKSFVGGGSTYSCTIRQGGTGALTITGSNTFADITNINTSAVSVLFAAGSNNTFTNFSLAGASGFVCTVGSTTTSQATLTKPSTWYMGANSTNGGNNTNLVFTAGGSSDYLSVSYINGVVSSGPVLNNTGNFFILF